LATVTLDIREGQKEGGWDQGLKVHVAEITLDTAYATGGYALAAADFEMASIVAVIPVPTAAADATHFALPVWNRATGKLQFFKTGTAVSSSASTGAFVELATNDTAVSASSKVLVLVIGTPL
jgi:hypothetical protein